MTDEAPDYRKQKQIALSTLIGASLALGVVDPALHLQNDTGLSLLAFIVLFAIGFRWLALDSAELDIRRPVWLNVGIVMAAAIFVPYYLYKTRPEGKRLPAIAGFFSLVLACMVATAIGATLFVSFSGTGPAG